MVEYETIWVFKFWENSNLCKFQNGTTVLHTIFAIMNIPCTIQSKSVYSVLYSFEPTVIWSYLLVNSYFCTKILKYRNELSYMNDFHWIIFDKQNWDLEAIFKLHHCAQEGDRRSICITLWVSHQIYMLLYMLSTK